MEVPRHSLLSGGSWSVLNDKNMNKQRYLKAAEKYINNPGKLFSDSLIKDLLDFGKEHHAQVVYDKCIKAGKTAIASRIASKYRVGERQYDSVISFALTVKAKM